MAGDWNAILGQRMRDYPFPVSSFRAKARNLFRLRSSRRCGESGIFAPKPSPRGEGAPKGRIGQERYERERRRPSQVRRLRKYPSAAGAVPLPRWGRQKGGGSAAKKKANPASLRSAAPSKGRGSRGHTLLPMAGGRIAHSPYRHFERKREIFFVLGQAEDVRIAVSPKQSLPLDAPKGRIGQERYERERERSSQAGDIRQHPIHRWRGPSSPMGNAIKLSGRMFLAPHRGSCPKG